MVGEWEWCLVGSVKVDKVVVNPGYSVSMLLVEKVCVVLSKNFRTTRIFKGSERH